MVYQAQRKCPSCGSVRLQDGSVSSQYYRFVPMNRKWVWLGYRIYTFVCLDCGNLGNYLSQQDVEDIQRRGNVRR